MYGKKKLYNLKKIQIKYSILDLNVTVKQYNTYFIIYRYLIKKKTVLIFFGHNYITTWVVPR